MEIIHMEEQKILDLEMQIEELKQTIIEKDCEIDSLKTIIEDALSLSKDLNYLLKI